MKDYYGLQRLKTPLEDMRQRTLDIIQRLIEDGESGAGPIEETMPDGSTMQLPSIPPRDYVDDHAFMSQVVREWLNDMPGQKLELSKPRGYANVVAYGKAQELAAQAKLMQGQAALPPGEEAAPGQPGEAKEGSLGAGPEKGEPPDQGEQPEGQPIAPQQLEPATQVVQ